MHAYDRSHACMRSTGCGGVCRNANGPRRCGRGCQGQRPGSCPWPCGTARFESLGVTPPKVDVLPRAPPSTSTCATTSTGRPRSGSLRPRSSSLVSCGTVRATSSPLHEEREPRLAGRSPLVGSIASPRDSTGTSRGRRTPSRGEEQAPGDDGSRSRASMSASRAPGPGSRATTGIPSGYGGASGATGSSPRASTSTIGRPIGTSRAPGGASGASRSATAASIPRSGAPGSGHRGPRGANRRRSGAKRADELASRGATWQSQAPPWGDRARGRSGTSCVTRATRWE